MALEGRESLIRDQIERRFAEMMARHNTVASDDRSQTHLNVSPPPKEPVPGSFCAYSYN